MRYKIALAISGGKDSMGMAYALKDMPGIVALTVDHKLRQESSHEALQVQAWMSELGIRHEVLTWEHEGITTDIQNKARTARYALMTNWCKENNVPLLMTAHHLEDQVETFLMRLAKGSGLKGLCAIKPQVKCNGVTLVRPFLSIRKAKLHAYVPQDRWVEDPSNENVLFERVRFRSLAQQYLTLDPQANILKSLQKLLDVDDYLEHVMHEALSEKRDLANLDYVIFERIINALFSKNGYPFKSMKLKNLYQSLQNPTFKATTLGSYVFKKNKNGAIEWRKEIR